MNPISIVKSYRRLELFYYIYFKEKKQKMFYFLEILGIHFEIIPAGTMLFP